MGEVLVTKEKLNEPELPAQSVEIELRRNHEIAVYVRIHVIDRKGDPYHFDAACFGFDLKKGKGTT